MKRAASEAREIELGKTLKDVPKQGKTTALLMHNITILEEFRCIGLLSAILPEGPPEDVFRPR